MKNYKKYKCYICGKDTQKLHYRTCGKNIQKHVFMIENYKNTWPDLCKNNGDKIKELYIINDISALEIYSKYNMNSTQFYLLLDFFGIKHKTSKDSADSKHTRKKYEDTCLKNYGGTNALSKNTKPYNKRNKTVKEKYGVDNVFQLEEIIEQINKTMLDTYGKKRITNIEKIKETKSKWTDEYKKEISDKIKASKENLTDEQKYNILVKREKTIREKYGNDPFYTMNKLESKISYILTLLGIKHSFSFFYGGNQFDFKLENNILLEVQGDFWHANPIFYKYDDILNHPGKKKMAGDLWKKDLKKKTYIENKGYTVLYIWENDIKQCKNDEELINLLLKVIRQK